MPSRTIPGAAAALAVCLAACGGLPSGSAPTRLSIATGGTGGVFYPYGGGVAKVLSAKLPGVEATAEVTAASVDNLKFLKQGTSDIAFTMADMAQDGLSGREAFAGFGTVPCGRWRCSIPATRTWWCGATAALPALRD
jgi:TRAP transporter TAXI family solute receptor